MGGASVCVFYGEDDAFTRSLISSVRRGWLPIPGRPAAYFSMVSHADAATPVAPGLEAPSGIYNVVDDEPLMHQALGEATAKLLRVSPPRLPPVWVTPLGGSVAKMVARSLRVSNAKLRRATKWVPANPSLREGIARVLSGTPMNEVHLSGGY